MKSYYKHVIFDLDGTLSDSREGIFNAYFYVIERMGLEPRNESQLNQLIGPPLQKGFEEGFQLKGTRNDEAVALFRDITEKKAFLRTGFTTGSSNCLMT